MQLKTLVTAFIALSCFTVTLGQLPTPQKNPFVLRAKQLGKTGLSEKVSSDQSPLKYKTATNGLYLKEHLAAMSLGHKQEEELIRKDFESRIKWLEETARQFDSENDASFAYAYSLLYLHKMRTGKDVDGNHFYKLSMQIRKAFMGVKGTDQQRRDFFEWTLCTAFTFRLFIGPPDQIVEMQKELAGNLFMELTGAAPSAIKFDSGTLLIEPETKL